MSQNPLFITDNLSLDPEEYVCVLGIPDLDEADMELNRRDGCDLYFAPEAYHTFMRLYSTHPAFVAEKRADRLRYGCFGTLHGFACVTDALGEKPRRLNIGLLEHSIYWTVRVASPHVIDMKTMSGKHMLVTRFLTPEKYVHRYVCRIDGEVKVEVATSEQMAQWVADHMLT